MSNLSLASCFMSFKVNALIDSCMAATVFINVWTVNAVFSVSGLTRSATGCGEPT